MNVYVLMSPACNASLSRRVKWRCHRHDHSFPRDTTHSCRADWLAPSFDVAGSRGELMHAGARLLSASSTKD